MSPETPEVSPIGAGTAAVPDVGTGTGGVGVVVGVPSVSIAEDTDAEGVLPVSALRRSEEVLSGSELVLIPFEEDGV